MESKDNKIITAGIISIIAGLWTFFAPLMFGLVGTAATNAYLVGAAIVILALIQTLMPSTSSWAGALNAIAGLWLALSPFVAFTGMDTVAAWSNVIAGIVVIVSGIWNISSYSMQHPMKT